MNSKLLFAVFGLLALTCAIQAKDMIKKWNQKKLAFHPAKAGEALNHLRRRRDTEEATHSPASSEELTDDEAMALLKFFLVVGWEEKKLEVLASFIDTMSDHETNITVVGWQRIYNDKGEVTEINTVQLVIPPKPQGEKDSDEIEFDINDEDEDEDEDEDDRALPYAEINELREFLVPLAEVGIFASATMEEYDKHGGDEGLIYLDKDELYANYDDFAIYNRTIYGPVEQVEEFIKSQPETYFGRPSVLRYDVDGHFIEDKSHVTPYILGSVSEYYEAPDEVIFKSPNFIAQISQQYPQHEIPKHLATTYNKEFPEYSWRVLVSPDNYHVHRDVSVTVSYDNFDLDEDSNVFYVVYGVKKNAATK